MSKEFVPLERRNVGDIVYRQLLDRISGGEWKDGDKIPSENELCESMQVGRNTVRQAIQKLSALGIVEARQGEGTFVKKIDTGFYVKILIPSVFLGEQDQVKLFEFEKCIQNGAAVIACNRASDEELGQLAVKLEDMKNAKAAREFNEKDIDFHVYLAEITHNEMLHKSMQLVKSMLMSGLENIADAYGMQSSIQAHEQIWKALSERNEAEAYKQMNEHMDDIQRKLLTVLVTKENV
ncbi:FadR/GntR family transcriptional regulator [Lachnospiraceae bacterium 54-53]